MYQIYHQLLVSLIIHQFYHICFILQEISEPLCDLKKGVDELKKNKTFKCILSVILTIGNFLNGAQVSIFSSSIHHCDYIFSFHASFLIFYHKSFQARGFSIEYLAKIPEVKDTVHKHSLLHHLCAIIIEQFPDTTDLYSEIGALARCSRVNIILNVYLLYLPNVFSS